MNKILITALLVVIGIMFGLGFMMGKSEANKSIKEYEKKVIAQNAEIQRLSNRVTTKIVTEYVDRVKVVTEKKYVYVQVARDIVPAQHELSNGWVHTHNSAATFSDPDPTRASDATPSGVADNRALETVVANYAICRANAEQLEFLQKWIRENLKVIPGNEHGG